MNDMVTTPCRARLLLLVGIAALGAGAARAQEPEAAAAGRSPAADAPVAAEDRAQGGAQDGEAAPAPPRRPLSRAELDGLRLTLSGYGDLRFSWHDHGENENRQGGAQKDSRLVFDTGRFVAELEVELPRYGIEAEAELEIEHGGTGAALELEYEEFGEYETEVEKGGEVLLEELWVEKSFGDWGKLRIGRFGVAVGQLWAAHLPTDHLGAVRPEAETALLPESWNEMGVQARVRLPWGFLTAQVVNGLDSTGFSSQRWVALGHQRRFELVRATDLAGVLRLDVNALPGLVAGVSGYYGGSSRNRPKADLVQDCQGGDPDAVAPCGWVNAPVLILDAHASLRRGRVRGSAVAIYGHLGNAEAVSQRNQRLSNALGVLRTPVSDNALALGAELGFDAASWVGLGGDHRLEPFARVDWYDTVFRPRAALFDNPRFERRVVTAGIDYALLERVFAKLDLSRRSFGSSSLRVQHAVRFATGFTY